MDGFLIITKYTHRLLPHFLLTIFLRDKILDMCFMFRHNLQSHFHRSFPLSLYRKSLNNNLIISNNYTLHILQHFILATRHACAFFHRNDQFLWVNREWSNVMYAMVCLNTYKSPVERGRKLKHTSMGDLRNRSRQVQLNTASNGIFFLVVLFRYSNCIHTYIYLSFMRFSNFLIYYLWTTSMWIWYFRACGLMLHFSVCVVIRFTWSFFRVPPLALSPHTKQVSEWDMILIYLRVRYAYNMSR